MCLLSRYLVKNVYSVNYIHVSLSYLFNWCNFYVTFLATEISIFMSIYSHVFINIMTDLNTARYAFITFNLWLAENEDDSSTNGAIYILKPCIYFARYWIMDL
jgi:hypothetical protein